MGSQRERLTTRTEATSYVALLAHVRTCGVCRAHSDRPCAEGLRLHDHWRKLAERELAAQPRPRRRRAQAVSA